MFDFSNKYYKKQEYLISLRGEGSLDLLDMITTNDITYLQPNFQEITLLLNESGKLLDILYVFFMAEPDEQLLIMFSNDNKEKVRKYLEKNLKKRYYYSPKPEIYYRVFLFPKDSYNICSDLGIKTPVADKFTVNQDIIAYNDELYNTLCFLIPEKKIIEFEKSLNKFLELNQNDFDYYRIINRIPAYPNEVNETIEPTACNLEKFIFYVDDFSSIDEDFNNDSNYIAPELHYFLSLEEVKPQDLIYFHENNIVGFITSVAFHKDMYYCLGIINYYNIKSRFKYHTLKNNEINYLKLKL